MTTGPRLAVRDLTLVPTPSLSIGATIGDVAAALVRERVPALLLGSGEAIVSEHDIVRAVARGRAPSEPARLFATPDPIAVSTDAPALEAVEVMLRHGLRAVVVVDDARRSVGMLTLVHAVEALLAVAEVPAWLSGLRIALRVEMDR
ncbi:MAG: CBS domain-containing protein [Acidimicrobiia bacterium]|jgi:CBS domain-containing protein